MSADGVVPVGRMFRRHPRRTIVVGVLVLVLVGLGTAALLQWRTRKLTVSEQQLAVALLTFRPPEHPGQSDDLSAPDLITDDQVRADPTGCLALVRLAPDGGLGAASWSGASGRPLQPVRTLTVRFADPGSARRALVAKRQAVRRCDRVALTFPPFTTPAQTFQVASDDLSWVPLDHLTYRLTSTDTYIFYVRRYGNTLTWSYANNDQINDDTGGRVRQAVVDDLVVRLQQVVQD